METSRPACHSRVRMLGLTLAGLLLALATSSCGGSQKPAASTDPEQPAAPVASAAARTNLHAGDYVLTEGPETTGFNTNMSLDNRGALSVAAMTDFASCMGRSGTDPRIEPLDSAKGPYFSTSDNLVFMGSVASVYPAAVITEAVRVTTEPSFPACVGSLLKRGYTEAADLPEGSTFTVLSTSVRKPPAGVTAMTRVKVSMTLDGPPVPMTFDLMFVFSGQVQSSFVVGRVFNEPDQAVINRVARQIVRKVTNQ